MYMDLTKILKDLSKSREVSDEILKYSIKPGQCNVLDMSVYTGMVVKRVAFQPYAIDGNVVYEIACKKHEWHKKHEDGHYWASTSGKNKDLKGTRRCSKCIGPLQFQNKRCIMYCCHTLSNTKSFQKIGRLPLQELQSVCVKNVVWCKENNGIQHEYRNSYHLASGKTQMLGKGHKTVE